MRGIPPALILAFVVFAAASPQLAPAETENKQGITPEHYFSFRFASDPHLSPDGKFVAYVLTTINQGTDRRESSVWRVPVDGPAVSRRLSAEGFNSNTPRWSPDGKTLAYLSSPIPQPSSNPDASAKDPPKQIYLQPTEGGDAFPLTKFEEFKYGVKEYQWSPGKTEPRIVAVGPSDPNDRTSDERHYTQTHYKYNDTGWFDDKRQHLWIVDVPSDAAKAVPRKKPRQITEDQKWNDINAEWSPDGVHIAFVRKEYEGSDSTDVWVIPAVGGAPTKISDHAFQDEQPRWLPDGMIVFTGKTERHEFPKLYVAPSAGGSESRLVAGGLDIIPNELHWSGGNTLLFSADRGGQTHIFGVDLAANAPSAFPVTSGERKVHGFDVNLEVRKMAYLANDFQNLDDVYVSDLDGGGERKLTELNNDLWKLKKIERQPVERLTYKNSIDGMKIEGFFVKPLNWQPEKKYPMVLVIHGGPNAMFGVDWYQEFQVYAAHDWAVFFCNPRGSTGYGEKFQRGIKDNWGGMDYEDVKAGMAEVLGRYNWIDREKLGVTGGSYGGFLTNWIVSHPDDRFKFKAAVTLRSISNFISDEGTRDGPYGHEDDFGGNVLDDKDKFENYWNRSPLKYARNVKTPTLILHSDKDFRVPLEQGEQWFRALQHFGVRSEMVVFPEENHNLTRSGKPKHLVQSLNWQVYWFDLFLNNNGDAKLPNRR